MFEKKFTAKDGTEVIFREPKASDVKDLMNMINEIMFEKNSGILLNKKVIGKPFSRVIFICSTSFPGYIPD